MQRCLASGSFSSMLLLLLLLLDIVYVAPVSAELPQQNDLSMAEGLQLVQRMATLVPLHFGDLDVASDPAAEAVDSDVASDLPAEAGAADTASPTPEELAVALQSSGKSFWRMVEELQSQTTLKHNPNKAHNCSAQVVIDVGLPRSGTTSFSGWAKLLGYKTFHYMPGLSWRDNNYSHFFLDLFARWPAGGVAFADSPWAEEACDIAAHRPEEVMENTVKFVNVLRDPQDWLTSLRTMRCKYQPQLSEERCRDMTSERDAYLGILRKMSPFHKLLFRMDHRWCHQLLVSGASLDDFCSDPEYTLWFNDEDRAAATAAMEEHSEDMRRCLGAQNMLVVRLEQEGKEHDIGEFLGCEVDVPAFPVADLNKHS